MSLTNLRRFLDICDVYTQRFKIWSKFYDSIRRAPHHCASFDCTACYLVATLPTLLFRVVTVRDQQMLNKRENMQSVYLRLVDISEQLNSAQTVSLFKNLLYCAERETEEFYNLDWEMLSFWEADKVLEKFDFSEFNFSSLKAINTVSLPFVCDFSVVPKIMWEIFLLLI